MRTFLFCLVCIFYGCNISEGGDNQSDKLEIVKLSEAIEKDPKNTTLLLLRADYNISSNNLESALFDLRECVLLDSLNSHFHYKLAKNYFELSKSSIKNEDYPMMSRYHLEKALEINTKDYRAHALLGELFLAFRVIDPKSYTKALYHLNRSLKIEYNQANTHMLLGYTFKFLEQESKAINCFMNSINVDPSFQEAYVQLGHIFHAKKDTTALTYYNNALKLYPKDTLVLYAKAMFYQDMLDWNSALESYSYLHKVSPFHANGHYNLGFIHMELGLYDVAANNFSDAIYSNSSFFEAYYSRGICFETLGNIAQAESDYKRAIAINANYVFAIDALKELRTKNTINKKQ